MRGCTATSVTVDGGRNGGTKVVAKAKRGKVVDGEDGGSEWTCKCPGPGEATGAGILGLGCSKSIPCGCTFLKFCHHPPGFHQGYIPKTIKPSLSNLQIMDATTCHKTNDVTGMSLLLCLQKDTISTVD
jgi:hypothetical protein